PVHRRGRRPGHVSDGSPGNLGGLDASALNLGEGNPTIKPRPHVAMRDSACGANNGAQGRYRRAKAEEGKRGGMSIEKSESLVVPQKPGNSPQGTRWREGETESRNQRRDRWRRHRAPGTSH